jgi:multiple sugar transport system ATP-binding protein
MAEIILKEVTKRFADGTEAVRQASFTIGDGEFFILVGPSGCGKSTLLNMIVGLEEVTEGEILVDGKLINDVDPKDRNMAMVFQSYALYPHMTVRENMAFPLKLAKLTQGEINRRVNHTAEILQLTPLLARRPHTLSGGQRQRVAMGRALVRNPNLFLLDEPLSNLDAQLRIQMRTEIARLQKRLGTTTVYVTHDQTEAMTLGDRVAVLHKGVVQQVGTPRELYNEPRNLFVAGFIGSPAMNFLPAEIRDHRLFLPIAEFALPEHLKEKLPRNRSGLIAGLRPEHFQDAAVASVDRQHGPSFRVTVDFVEWLGAELYVHFETPGLPPVQYGKAPAGFGVLTPQGDRSELIARLDPASQAKSGESLELRFDAGKLQLFDRDTGENLA